MFRKTRRRVRALEGRVFAVEDSGRETWERVDAQDVRIGALEKKHEQLLEELSGQYSGTHGVHPRLPRIDSLAGSVDKLAELENHLHIQMKGVHTAGEAIGELEKRLDELWPYAQLLEERIEELEDKAKSHGAALDNLRGRHECLSQRVTEMEKSGMTTGEKVFELEQVVARYQERVDALDGHSHIDAQEKVAERLRRMVAPPPPVIKDGEYADHPLKRSRKDREFRRRIIEALRQAQNGKLYFIEEVYDHIHEAVYGEE